MSHKNLFFWLVCTCSVLEVHLFCKLTELCAFLCTSSGILWHILVVLLAWSSTQSEAGVDALEPKLLIVLQYFSANILYFTDVYLDCICVLVCSSWLHDYFDWTLPFLFKCWSEFKAFLLNTRQDRSCMCL